MRFLKILDKLVAKIEELALSFGIIGMAIILIGNVISRVVFNASWTFAEEVGQFMVIIVTWMGISYAARKGRHINMSALFDILPHKWKKIFLYVISAVTSISMFFLSYLALDYTLMVHRLGRVSPALRVPMYLIVMFTAIGFFTGGLQYARNLWINIKEDEIYLGTEKTDRGDSIDIGAI